MSTSIACRQQERRISSSSRSEVMERNRDDDWRAPQVNTATAGSLPPGGSTAGCAARSGRRESGRSALALGRGRPRTRVARGGRARNRIRARSCRCIPPRRGLRARVVTGREAVLEHELGIAPPAPGRPGRGRTAPYLPAISVPFGRSDLLQLLLDASFCFVLGLFNLNTLFSYRNNEAAPCVKYFLLVYYEGSII